MDLNELNNIDIMDLFSRIGAKASKVAVNISPRCEIEIMELDKGGLINNYSKFPYNYNNISKEIENVSDVENNIKTAFANMKLSKASKIYLSIPTYFMEHVDLPLVDCTDDEIKQALVTTAEKNYIFKKYDPAISFYKFPTNENEYSNQISLCYTALRADEFIKIKDIFENLGLKVVAIDSSYASLINGVIATNIIDQAIYVENRKWNIVNITSNSFVVFGMQGNLLTSFYEEPLAVKSFSEEEIYSVINSSLELVLSDYPAEQLVVVSQSDNVSAGYLTETINVNYPKLFIEDNVKYKKRPHVDMNLNMVQSHQEQVTLEAVGIAARVNNQECFKFDFLDAPLDVDTAVESIIIPFNGKDIEITSDKLLKTVILLGLSIVIVCALLFGLAFTLENSASKTQEAVVQKVKKLESELDIKPQTTGITLEDFLAKSYSNNVNYRKSYAAIAREIPDMLWLEEFQIADDSKVYIQGRSYKMDDVLNYYDSLNKLGKFSNLRITTLKISNTEISELLLTKDSDMTEETTYEFAFGQHVYVEPNLNATDEKIENKTDSVPLPPGSDDGNKKDTGND
ncbi:MAG: PilN domain-containing protein, partial [Candidatus Gastranaerophilales bacterium]|nr:PilN domain-containing protein [Candidatus Gastranaerophilales bacterium]